MKILEINKLKPFYLGHKSHCEGRRDANGNQIKMILSFGEWLNIWIDSGKLNERGVGKGKYCMARHNDVGHYEIGNVSVILHSQNVSDAHLGKEITAEHKEKVSKARLGKKLSKEHKENISAGVRGEKHPNFGKKFSSERKAKMSASNKGQIPWNLGKSHSVEARSNISAAVKAIPKMKCNHCGKEASPGNHKRWHGENCKVGIR